MTQKFILLKFLNFPFNLSNLVTAEQNDFQNSFSFWREALQNLCLWQKAHNLFFVHAYSVLIGGAIKMDLEDYLVSNVELKIITFITDIDTHINIY